ncbi:MAG: zinc ribbon domain-containing protein [Oscillospiraceae bacterium]|nr:zinc ribbon domain-containing protein [Oscillospiraceae bacterium]
MYCPKCGKELITNAKFCGSCGTQITQSTVNNANVAANAETSNKSIESASLNSGDTVNENTSKKNKTIGKVIVGIGILIGIIIIIVFLFNDDEPVRISNISYDYADSWSDSISLSLDAVNISNKDIAYIYIDTYAYDKMGTEVEKQTLQITGPIEAGETYSAAWDHLFYEPGVYAVWPKDVKVVYIKGGEATFENEIYCYKKGFYTKGLK